MKNELSDLVAVLHESPRQGTPIGSNCYKIRLSIASKGKGKSGGAWVIANVVLYEGVVYLLSIYDKSEKESLTDVELKDLLKNVPS